MLKKLVENLIFQSKGKIMDNKNLGWGLLIVGASVVFWAFFIFDTSIAVDAYTRVNNLGLLNDQRNYAMLGGFVAAFGIFLIFRAEPKEKQGHSNNQANISPNKNDKTFAGNKSIENDAYKIFLVQKYSIEKNVTLDKFIVKDKLFNSIEEALLYASGLDESSSLSQLNVKKSNKNLPSNFPNIFGEYNYRKIVINDFSCMHFINDSYGFIKDNICYVYETKDYLKLALEMLNDQSQMSSLGLIEKIKFAQQEQSSKASSEPQNDSKQFNSSNDDESSKYGITFDGEKYCYKEYKYDKLEDAIAYAKKTFK